MPQVREEGMKTKDEIIAAMQRTIRESREAIGRLQAGDYTGFKFCTGVYAAEQIINNRFKPAIEAAQRVIDANLSPEDLA